MFRQELDPHQNFVALLKGATDQKVAEPTAMSLSTVGKDLMPSVRVVYCKESSPEGFIFYTNYNGSKSRDIALHPQVCLNFYWPELWQQIRINGVAEKTTRAKSEQYFATRPRLSQIGAWASHQSEALASREEFLERMKSLEERYQGQEVPCPPHWGGFLVRPQRYEFWFGGEGRLHERYLYVPAVQGGWSVSLLNP